MKKLCFLFVAIFLAVSLCSCGGKTAEEVTPADFPAALDAAIGENPEEAEQLYLGKTVQTNFIVVQIMWDGEIVMSSDGLSGVPAMEHTRLTARLSEEDLATVKQGDLIAIEGTISGFSEYTPSKWSDFGTCTKVELSPAKIVEKTFQVTGKIKQVNDSPYAYLYKQKRYSFLMEGGNVLRNGEVIVYLEEEGDYEAGQTVTAMGTLRSYWRAGASGEQGHYDPDAVRIFMDDPTSIEISGK